MGVVVSESVSVFEFEFEGGLRGRGADGTKSSRRRLVPGPDLERELASLDRLWAMLTRLTGLGRPS